MPIDILGAVFNILAGIILHHKEPNKMAGDVASALVKTVAINHAHAAEAATEH